MLTSSITPARVNPLWQHGAEHRISLDGAWSFALDADDRGCKERWFTRPDRLHESIQVPGCWQGQGFGGNGEDMLWDFQLRARTYRATYTGTGWYARAFTVPTAWQGKAVWLNFGGVHPSADVWVNGERVGAHHLPFVPFACNITPWLRWEGENAVVVRVHEHHREFGLAFDWQGHWSGLYRGVELTATGPTYLRHCGIYPDADNDLLRVVVELGGVQPPSESVLQVVVRPADGETPVVARECVLPGDGTINIPVPSPRRWSPDAPHLYRVDLALRQGDETLDALSERTGFVTLSTAGHQFLINGDPYYLRGTGDFISCPETGCPDTDRARWRRKLTMLREYGYNYVRCQSFVYGPEYYDIADEVGLLVQSEMGMLGAWGGMSPMHVYQWPKPTPDNYPVLKRQWDLVVQRDAHHPSANLYCMSNEYAAPHFPHVAWDCYHRTKALKPTALVIWTDGGYHPEMPGDFVNAFVSTCPHDLQGDPSILESCGKPVIEHECRWWSSFPDVRLKDKYEGAVRPYAIEIAERAAERQGLAHLLPRFAEASQRLQFQESKLKMEGCRRGSPTLAGICHFNAMDGNPSPQGIFTEFYERKLVDSRCWQQTNGDAVLLAGLEADHRALTAGETFRCSLLVSDFAHPPFQSPDVEWQLCAADGRTLAKGAIPYAHTPFRTCEVGEVEAVLPDVPAPVALTLHARVHEGEREITNDWSLWLFPAHSPVPAGVCRYGDPAHSWLGEWSAIPVIEVPDATSQVLLTAIIDDKVVEYLSAGGRVILAATEGLVRPHPPNFGYVHYYFTPPANYSPYEDGQNGTLVADHPMLGAFPHEGVADLHWFRMIDQAPPLDLEPLGLTEGEPVVRAIHRYPVCRSLGYLHEVAVGHGRLMVCGLQLSPQWVEARYLLAQLCAYAIDPSPAPAPEATPATLARLKAGTALTLVPRSRPSDCAGVQAP
jgi:hypothetical protein